MSSTATGARGGAAKSQRPSGGDGGQDGAAGRLQRGAGKELPADELLRKMREAQLPEPECEHRFLPGKQWRFDFAFPALRLAAEVEGGTWQGGGHNRGRYYGRDCLKYTVAALHGWRVLRFTSDMVRDGTAVDLLLRAFTGATPDAETVNALPWSIAARRKDKSVRDKAKARKIAIEALPQPEAGRERREG